MNINNRSALVMRRNRFFISLILFFILFPFPSLLTLAGNADSKRLSRLIARIWLLRLDTNRFVACWYWVLRCTAKRRYRGLWAFGILRALKKYNKKCAVLSEKSRKLGIRGSTQFGTGIGATTCITCVDNYL